MASASSLLSEDMFQCSICLDVFTEPVSTPCGHNYCKACVTEYWDTSDQCCCPLCKTCFVTRPDLLVNTLISEMSAQLRKKAELKAELKADLLIDEEDSPDQEAAQLVEVPCDICPGIKLKALKSCLVCLTSYCETHLEPHQRVKALQRHKLIDPVENLDDRMCKKHDKMLELFCRTDQMCVCVMCADHRSHDTVPLEEEYERRKAQLKTKTAEVERMVQERLRKIQEVKSLAALNKKDTETKMADCVEVVTALVAAVQRSHSELIEVAEGERRAVEKQAEGFITELEQEIVKLQKRRIEMEKFSRAEDHLHLLHSIPTVFFPLVAKDWSEIGVSGQLCGGAVRRAVDRLEETLRNETKTLLKCTENMVDLPEDVRLERIRRRYAVDVTLDPHTAHPRLFLSEDRKQVRDGKNFPFVPQNPNRFDKRFSVLGNEGFSSGRVYYEVQVEGKTKWDLGLVRQSITRKGTVTTSPQNGYWIIRLRRGDEYKAVADLRVPLPLVEDLERIGVYVDYEEGLISFYDVEAKTLIYSFAGCAFSEKIYPYLRPCSDDDGGNTAPMIITPVEHEE